MSAVPSVLRRTRQLRSAEQDNGALSAALLRRWNDLDALRPEWNTLLQASAADTVFLTWEWIKAWVDAFGWRREPLLIAVRDRSGRLCALAPLYREAYVLPGGFRYRMLRVMGDRPTAAEYPDWIVRRDCEALGVERIAQELNRYPDWDGLWMPQVSGWTGGCERIASNCRKRGLHVLVRSIPFACADLPASIATYEQSLNPDRRRKLRTERKRILGREQVRILRTESASDLAQHLGALIELHTLRRRRLGDEGAFAGRPEEERFYRKFAPVALDRGWLRLYVLREQNAIKAAQLGYCYNGVLLQVQEGFDPDYLDGVGNVLRFEAIRQCIEEGVRAYDFLGGYGDHKRRWGAALRHGHDLFIGRNSWLNRVMFRAGVWPTGKYLHPLSGRTNAT